jgi:hypothetical protein
MHVGFYLQDLHKAPTLNNRENSLGLPGEKGKRNQLKI